MINTAQSNKRQMAKRINSVCERVTEIKNKRKKINSINKVINNEHKTWMQEHRTEHRSCTWLTANRLLAICDLSCNPTKTR